jgi:hypothetical protein
MENITQGLFLLGIDDLKNSKSPLIVVKILFFCLVFCKRPAYKFRTGDILHSSLSENSWDVEVIDDPRKK